MMTAANGDAWSFDCERDFVGRASVDIDGEKRMTVMVVPLRMS